MRIIGVTGGIGTGKSTISRILSNLGAKIIDADKIARRIVEKEKPALAEILSSFGESVFTEKGDLDRKKLADIVFNNEDKLKELNRITHKYIAEEIISEIGKAKEESINTVVIDAALPFEHVFLDVVDEIWVVTSEMEIRINRIMQRSQISKEEVIDRINSQMKEQEYLAIANQVISNNDDIVELEKNIIKLYLKI